jgi:hypothetical protein
VSARPIGLSLNAGFLRHHGVLGSDPQKTERSSHERCSRARSQAYGFYEMAGPERRISSGDDGTQTDSVDS